jgi:hypothetical protein
MRNGTSIFGRYVGSSEYYPEYCDDKKAMWWVKIIDPAGVDQECDGGGTTSAEAAAVAWINATVGAWWVDGPSLGAEDYAKVPRRVPDGWRFELDEAPL